MGESVPELSTTPKTAAGAQVLYDKWASSYDRSLKSWGYQAPERVAEVLAEFKVAGALLDVGCGTGMSGVAAADNGVVKGGLCGLDISAESLRIAMEKGIYTDTKVADLDKSLPLDDSSFDGAFSVGVFSYVENFRSLFRELCRVLKPGGYLVFTHRTQLWDENSRGCRDAANELEKENAWKCVRVGEPEAYMPLNPDPTESCKQIRLIVFQKSDK